MANEVEFSFLHGKTCYFLVFNRIGQIWNTNTVAWENYVTANYGNYTTSVNEIGTASSFYQGNFPSAILAGVYSVAAKQQIGGSPAETDPTVATGNIEWNGTVLLPRSDLATSGQVGQFAPIKIYRGEMVQNFPFKLVSSIDHVSVFTSGICSGQISRDGGAFGALQSGIFSEVGLGWYVTTLTSGDLLANTAAIVFTANGISGGVSDPRDFGMILQRVSGGI